VTALCRRANAGLNNSSPRGLAVLGSKPDKRPLLAVFLAAIMLLILSLTIAEWPNPIKSQSFSGYEVRRKEHSAVIRLPIQDQIYGARFSDCIPELVTDNNLGDKKYRRMPGIDHRINFGDVYCECMRHNNGVIWQNGWPIHFPLRTGFNISGPTNSIPTIKRGSDVKFATNQNIEGWCQPNVSQFDLSIDFSNLLLKPEASGLQSTDNGQDFKRTDRVDFRTWNDINIYPRALSSDGSFSPLSSGLRSLLGVSETFAHDTPLPIEEAQLANSNKGCDPASEYQLIRENGYSIGSIGQTFVRRILLLSLSLLICGFGTIWWGSNYLYGKRHRVGTALMISGVFIGSCCYVLLVIATMNPGSLLWLL
jgi:hypothetical protein